MIVITHDKGFVDMLGQAGYTEYYFEVSKQVGYVCVCVCVRACVRASTYAYVSSCMCMCFGRWCSALHVYAPMCSCKYRIP